MDTRLTLGLAALLACCTTSGGNSYATTVKKGSGEIVGMVKKGGSRVHMAVVSLTEVSGNYHASSEPVRMNQADKEFLPHVLAVMKGSTVRFENSDPFFHNVFSSSRIQSFNVSQEKKGDYTDVKFPSVGIVPIKCHIHANMKAYIIVLPNPFFGVTNSSGIFHINGVPAGSYTLKVWSEQGSTTQSITVGSGKAEAVIQL